MRARGVRKIRIHVGALAQLKCMPHSAHCVRRAAQTFEILTEPRDRIENSRKIIFSLSLPSSPKDSEAHATALAHPSPTSASPCALDCVFLPVASPAARNA